MSHIAKGASLFQLIPAKEFRELCDRFNINPGVRKLTAQKQVLALVMAYVLKLDSLREIECTLGIPRSTLRNANSNREPRFFEELCQLILWKIHTQLKARKLKQAIRTVLAMDSTECRVHGLLSKLPKWKTKTSSMTNGKASTKLHLIWNTDSESIESFKVTAGRVNDAPVAKTLKIMPNCTYVFDRAYNELYFWWSILHKKSHFVSRLKKHSYNNWKYKKKLNEYQGKEGVLWEQIWKPSYDVLRKNQKVPKDIQFRHIVYRSPETKKIFNFITSDFNSSAEEIADTYKKRWSVEIPIILIHSLQVWLQSRT
jgi:hypothetical protein